ncbi:hypothetical protein EZV62_013317 [Acer yangbiense]|uniref:Myb-like domain-containing protein n=1 Tax=Acer yangbiense TaxID=1000413 RepID=A0A5C7HYV6_9ROSI|nr:hypothetical protein EZV62_013317 [Acer yangbiense]
MGRAPCCDKTKVKRGPWSPEEDSTLIRFIETHGTAVNNTHEISLMSSDPNHQYFSHHDHVSEFSTNLKNSSSSIFTSSQEGGSSSVSVSADNSSSLAMENNNMSLSADGSAVHEDLQGGILMDFSFGIGGPIYNEFINGSSGIWFQDQKATSHEEAGLSYGYYPNLGDDQSSSYADIKQEQGLINQSVINQY